MADITFAQIEAALVTRIEAALPYLAQCASYAGQIEDVNNGLPVEAPACFVSFDGFRADREMSSRKSHVGIAEYSIIVVADSYTGTTLNRTADQGAYAIVHAVISAVDDNALAVTGFQGVNFVDVTPLKVDKLRAMYRVRFDVLLEVTR